jgi:16S rRNA G966 N2-methylase RsmD
MDRVYDAATGVRTVAFDELHHPGAADEHPLFYSPSDWPTLRRLMASIRVQDGDAFLDYGAGRGRVVIAAAGRPFRRVTGVELSPDLAAVARANVDRARPRLTSRDVVIEVADASEYEVGDDVTVAYAYSPFTGAVFAAAIGKVLESLDRRPRPFLFVYAVPYEHNYLLSTERFKPIDSRNTRWSARGLGPGDRVVSYAVRAADGEFPAASRLMEEPRVREPRWHGSTDPQVRLHERLAGDGPLVRG